MGGKEGTAGGRRGLCGARTGDQSPGCHLYERVSGCVNYIH